MALRIETELPDSLPIGGSAEVFELPLPDVNEGSVAELARRLGMAGEGTTSTAGDDWLTYVEGPRILDVNMKTGGLIYRDQERYGIQTDRPFEIRDDEAADIATRFIENTQIVPGHEAQPAKVTHLRGAIGEVETGEVTESVIDAGVVFARKVGDMAVTGPGGFLMINIDPDGEVVGARRAWRQLGRLNGTVSLRPVTTLISALEQIASEAMGDTIVTKAQLGYFEQGIADPQTMLEPAYVAVYHIQNGDVSVKSATVVHAGDRAYEDLEVPKRFPAEPQLPRI